MEESEEAGDGEIIGQILAFLDHFPQLHAVSGEICAFVENKIGKQNKDLTKKCRQVGDGSCDNSGARRSGRIVKKCENVRSASPTTILRRIAPIRKDGVAQGGPGRLLNGKGRGKFPSYPT